MSSIMPEQAPSQEPAVTSLPTTQRPTANRWSWLRSWELYLILLVAAFLRLYGIQTTEFDGDQADIFRMAHDAVSHAHLVATSNVASVGIFNPPGIIYFLMIPAAFSANPVWSAVLTALLAIASVGLTYFCVRRYFGRPTATIASALYATAALSIFYSRFIWNQNLLLFFVPLFIFLLLEGIVKRRKGWLMLAIPLLGLLLQLHASTIILAAPLLVALVLAPGTVRWRDLLSGLGLLLVLYVPYILWEISYQFHDITVLLTNSNRENVYDNQIWLLYQTFLSLYYASFSDSRSTLYPIMGALDWVQTVMTALAVAGIGLAIGQGVWSRRLPTSVMRTTNDWRQGLINWWKSLRASPYRSSLLMLATWQLALLAQVHHTIKLQLHYLIVFAPGQYILIALLFVTCIDWLRRHSTGWQRRLSSALAVFAALLVIVQLLGSGVSVFDAVQGKFAEKNFSHPYYNDLQSLQRALAIADQAARAHQIKRVYVNADKATFASLRYLSEQMHTPTTVSNESCLVLPDPATGAFLWLVAPYNTMNTTIVSQFPTASLIATPERLSGSPFKLYLVQSTPRAEGTPQVLSNGVQLLQSQYISVAKHDMLLTRWSTQQVHAVTDGEYYTYNIATVKKTTARPDGANRCTVTALSAGDQLWRPLPLPSYQTDLYIKFEMFTVKRYDFPLQLPYSSIHFDTFRYQVTNYHLIHADDGNNWLSFPTS